MEKFEYSKREQNPMGKLKQYIEFETMRSSGPGGQHLQKTETKVRGKLSIDTATKHLNLSPEQIQKLQDRFPSGYVEATSQETRSQSKNKALSAEKIIQQIQEALKHEPKRKLEIKEPVAAKEKRIKEKKRRAEIKQMRQKPETNE